MLTTVLLSTTSSIIITIVVILVVLIIIGLFVGEEKIRCQSCGYRGLRSDFHKGRCPYCNSLER